MVQLCPLSSSLQSAFPLCLEFVEDRKQRGKIISSNVCPRCGQRRRVEKIVNMESEQ